MSKIIDEICLLRDWCESKDYNKLAMNIYFINYLRGRIERFAKKALNGDKADFGYQDLLETADDIAGVLQSLTSEIKHTKIVKKFLKDSPITKEYFDNYSDEMAKKFAIREALTPLHSHLTYLGVSMKILEDDEYMNTDLNYIFTDVIKSFCKEGK